MLDCEEKKEKTGGEEKKEDKEYISYLSFSKPETTDKQAFAFYFIISSLSPALDRPTPPPDNRLSV